MSPRSDFEKLTAGQVLAGKYRLERLIGKGGMGAVYAAHHELLHQRVAIKLLLADASADDATVTRFLNEARAAARIPSDRVVRVLDVGILAEGRPFLVMEYLEGRDLAHLMEERGRLTPKEAVDYVLDAIEPIAQAHALGIVHRDLKPSNLFVTERADGTRVLKVLDFGIAKAFRDAAGTHAAITTQGLLGSPAYMAPEYVRSAKSFEPRSDMWALGVILYELLSGALPFRGDNVGEILVSILEKTPTPLIAIAPSLPPGLVAIVERCLRKKPQERFADLAELAEALEPYASKRSASIARIRTTMKVLEVRPAHTAAQPPRAGPEDPTAFAQPAVGVQTHDSWSGASPTVRRARPRSTMMFVAFALSAVAAAGVALVLILKPPSDARAPANASESATPSESASATATAIEIAPATMPTPSATTTATATASSSDNAASSSRPKKPPPTARPRPAPTAPSAPPTPTLTRDRL